MFDYMAHGRTMHRQYTKFSQYPELITLSLMSCFFSSLFNTLHTNYYYLKKARYIFVIHYCTFFFKKHLYITKDHLAMYYNLHV